MYICCSLIKIRLCLPELWQRMQGYSFFCGHTVGCIGQTCMIYNSLQFKALTVEMYSDDSVNANSQTCTLEKVNIPGQTLTGGWGLTHPGKQGTGPPQQTLDKKRALHLSVLLKISTITVHRCPLSESENQKDIMSEMPLTVLILEIKPEM